MHIFEILHVFVIDSLSACGYSLRTMHLDRWSTRLILAMQDEHVGH